MSNPNDRGPGGWPPPPPGTPYGAPTPYGHAPQPTQPSAPQPYPQPQQPYAPPAPNPYAPQPYGYAQPQQPIQVVVQNQIQPYGQQYGYAQQPYAYPNAYMAPPLKKDTAILLCLLGFFFGINGLHRFYLRQTGLGILWLLTGGVCVIGQIVDAVQLLSMSQQEFDRRYNYPQLP